MILTQRDPRRGDVVACCSAMAQRLGIRVGMPVVEATAILSPRTAPTSFLTRLPYSPADDRAALEQMAAWCQQFSPLVGLEESLDPSSLLLDITGSAPRLGGEERLVSTLVDACRQQGYLAFAAVAPTAGAAWAISHSLLTDSAADTDDTWQRNEGSPPHQTKLAAWRIIGNEDLPRTLEPLPLAALRIDPSCIETLHLLGITTMGQLLRLPRAGLRRRFGEALMLRIDQALGARSEPVVGYFPPPALEVGYLLEYPTPRKSVIEPILEQLTVQLANHLQQRNIGAVQLECTCRLQDRSTTCLTVGLYQPTANAMQFFRLLGLRLESLRLAAPLAEVRLRASITAELEYSREMLWGESRYDERSLGQLIEKLSNRLGANAVVGARLLADPQPERAFRWIPLSGRKPTPPASTAAARARHQPSLRPLSLQIPARPLSHFRTTQDGQPASFHHEQSRYQVEACWGPERIQTGWWRGHMIHRDYYRVEDHHGCRHWIYRELESGQWFLQGSFL